MKAPFPYFGSKSTVAAEVWSALGDCPHYIEPFCGSCAVLLARSRWDPARHVETVNDADGHIANVWRALQADPDEVARWCDWPVNHADLIARKGRLNLDTGGLLGRLCADDCYYDSRLAGYYIWAASCWIGNGLICPNQIPHLTLGKGVHAKGQIPHLADGSMGVHAKGRRSAESGVGVREPYNVNVYQWFRKLSERLRHVRVVCGDWQRVCGGDWQTNPGSPVGIFFDPPYSKETNRDMRCYATDSGTIAHDVREWCLSRGGRKDHRIVLAGYYDEHASLLNNGWTVHRWSAQGGYSKLGDAGGKARRHQEALFFSPHCLGKADTGFGLH